MAAWTFQVEAVAEVFASQPNLSLLVVHRSSSAGLLGSRLSLDYVVALVLLSSRVFWVEVGEEFAALESENKRLNLERILRT